MARKRDRSELEHLRGEIRRLESEVRRLKKQLRQQEKETLNRDIDILDELLNHELTEKETKLERCSQCGIGYLEVTDLGIKKLIKCTECSYRRTR